VSPELAQLLQTMARDLANVQQQLEQLKASQEQMASDNAKTVEQLKASQEQMTRLVAKASEQNLRPKTSAPPPRPIATATRKPVPTLPSQQARERAQAPIQLQPDDQQLSSARRAAADEHAQARGKNGWICLRSTAKELSQWRTILPYQARCVRFRPQGVFDTGGASECHR
jgi:chromosome segregation ATPase